MKKNRSAALKTLKRIGGLSLVWFLLWPVLVWGEQEQLPPGFADEEVGEMPAAVLAAIKKVNQGKGRRRSAVGVQSRDSGVVKVEPGRNVNVNVAGDQLNRIVTPFTNPLVHTVSKAKVTVDGSVVYVSLSMEEGPVTLIITENGESDPSIILTLTPKVMEPREVRLAWAGGGGLGSVVSLSGSKSAKWERSQPYIEALEKVMLGTARGEVPPGYNLRDPINLDPTPRCRLPVRVEPGQVLEGHSFLMVISKLTNISSSPLLINEAECYQEGVRAVAVWPHVQLGPGQSTELYVAFGREMGQRPNRRPSVLTRPAAGKTGGAVPAKTKPRRPSSSESDNPMLADNWPLLNP